MPRLSKIGAAALGAFGWTSGAAAVTANFLVVAGGGGGGYSIGGGGGAGGYRTGTTSLNPTLSYTVTVGAGGNPGVSGTSAGGNGSDSVFNTITSTGGGGGGGNTDVNGKNGGSGGGSTVAATAGNGNTPSTSPSQGNNGGTAANALPYSSAGGGGAFAVGANANPGTGNGGAGTASSISGTSVTYAGGGGGGRGLESSNGTGGAGGGGDGGISANGKSGTANLGGGGGGGGNGVYNGGQGGSGVVIISYPSPQKFGGGVVTVSGGNTIHTFTTSGTLSPLNSLTANFLVVAGGGGGGGAYGGGGGAGGLRSSVTNTGGGGSLESTLTIDTNSIYLVTVGAGGVGAQYTVSQANSGSNSAFLSITSTGGGRSGLITTAGASGGSGGGGGSNSGTGAAGGSGTANQGFAGGTGAGYDGVNGYAGGGGGGAGAVGQSRTAGQNTGGNGGAGVTVAITGSSVGYAGGGGGSGYLTSGGTATDGGGAGADYNVIGSSGSANRGGGGGGGGAFPDFSGSGGSGVVIISYPGSTQQMAGGTVTVAGGNVIHTFTSSGYLTPIVLVNNSLRFRQSASSYLNRTPTTAGNIQKFTLSVWYKPGNIGTSFTNANFLSAGGDGSNILIAGSGAFGSTVDNRFLVRESNAAYQFYWPMVFRDPAAWYHIVLAVDTTQTASANRAKLYVNGVDQGAFSGTGYALNATTSFNSVTTHYIGAFNSSFYYTSCYFAEYTWIDGQQLTPNSFGTFNGLGVWQPIRYGGSYGTNGFYLPFNAGTSSFAGLFNGSSQYLTTPNNTNFAPTGDFTIACNFYVSSFPSTYAVVGGTWASGTSDEWLIQIQNNGALRFLTTSGTSFSSAGLVQTGKWYYFSATRSGNTITASLNGVPFSTYTLSGTFGSSSKTVYIGVQQSPIWYFNGYISNFILIDGTAYTTPPTSPWTAVTGTKLLTLQNSSIVDNSTNGYTITNNGSVTTSVQYPFINQAFNDQSPQGNNWTPNNIGVLVGSTYDSMTDVPTLTSATAANYATFNGIGTYTNLTSNLTYSNGNLQVTYNNADVQIGSSIRIPNISGKFYLEFTATYSSSSNGFVGLFIPNGSVILQQNGVIGNFGVCTIVSTTGVGYSSGQTISFAIDADTKIATIRVNNTVNTVIDFSAVPTGVLIDPAVWLRLSGDSFIANYGQQPFTYTPPSGFVGLNTFNLPTPTIGATPATTANKYFDVSIYTGTGALTQSVTNSNSMQPDFVWVKDRSQSTRHVLTDSVRGSGISLYSNITDPEGTNDSTGYLSAFNSNGFTLNRGSGGLGERVNYNGDAYVGWQWRASNATAVTNTAGSITSTVSANTTAGFSIVTYTGNGTASTVGHGLGVAPSMMLVKRRNGAANWFVYHSALGATQYIYLDATAAAITASGAWNNTAPTSTVFSVGNFGEVNLNTGTYVAYCFAPIAGYSAFGSYTGNGSTDGTFVYTGFRPRFVLIKVSSGTTGNWTLVDTSRNPYNVMNSQLNPDASDAEFSGSNIIDAVSNGFKLRNTPSAFNGSGNTYIYMAFAENPFKYANAR